MIYKPSSDADINCLRHKCRLAIWDVFIISYRLLLSIVVICLGPPGRFLSPLKDNPTHNNRNQNFLKPRAFLDYVLFQESNSGN